LFLGLSGSSSMASVCSATLSLMSAGVPILQPGAGISIGLSKDLLQRAAEVNLKERRPVVLSTQRAAQASLEWFENIGQYAGQDPLQFTFNLLTRSRRITFDNLALRDPGFARRVREDFARRVGGPADTPAMFQGHRVGNLELKNRVVVSAMDMYSAVDGVPGDFHLVHLGSKAAGGAGLVMTEMIGVSARGRITRGCTGLYTEEQVRSWRRVVDFVHATTTAKIGAQIGHSGRKGSTKLMWEGMDEPLDDEKVIYGVFQQNLIRHREAFGADREPRFIRGEEIIDLQLGYAFQEGSPLNGLSVLLQVVVLPVSSAQDPDARALVDALVAEGLRPRLDPDGSLGARIRESRRRREPLIAVIGAVEAEAAEVQVRDVAAGGERRVSVVGLVAAMKDAYVSRAGEVSW
jgi:hypothetical protein